MPGRDGFAAMSTLAFAAAATLVLTSPQDATAQSASAATRNAEMTQGTLKVAGPGDDMTDLTKLTREWLDMVAMGPADAWNGTVSDDVVIRLPYAPAGVESELRGLQHARETLSHHWKTKRSFVWRDLVIRRTEDPELLVTTARSDVVLMNGQPYNNNYIMLTRIRDGKIVEHVEYFNPLPIIEMLKN